MCIIMYSKPGVTIPEEHLDTSRLNHPHGCGLTFVHPKKKKAVIYRTMDYDRFKYVYNLVAGKYRDTPILVHFRKLTHGTAVLDNCHPFRINNYQVFVHNGTVHPCKPDAKNEDNLSDTRIFNTSVLKHLSWGWEKNKGIRSLVEEYIGFSKVVVLDNKKNVTIFNEQKGEWNKDKDIWYSNNSYTWDEAYHERKKQWGYKSSKGNHYHDNWKSSKNSGRYTPNKDCQLWSEDNQYFCYDPHQDLFYCWDKKYGTWAEWDELGDKFKDSWRNVSTQTKNNIKQLPQSTGHVEPLVMCDSCRIKFNGKDLDTYVIDGVQHLLMCKDCADSHICMGMKLVKVVNQ